VGGDKNVPEFTREPGMVAHACNPSYLEDRDQEDHGWAKIPQDPILMNA
jgi:hypothetical protein